jgi:hypothetical protein
VQEQQTKALLVAGAAMALLFTPLEVVAVLVPLAALLPAQTTLQRKMVVLELNLQ